MSKTAKTVLFAVYYFSSCSKYPPFALTQAWNHCRLSHLAIRPRWLAESVLVWEYSGVWNWFHSKSNFTAALSVWWYC